MSRLTLNRPQSGFTLVELLLVAVILGILAAVVVPRFTTNTDDTKNQALKSNLAAVRAAIDLYSQQHNGDFPGAKAAGTATAGSEAAFIAQLTKYTDSAGAPAEAKDSTHIYGPYLRAIPVEPISNSATVTINSTGDLSFAPSAAGNGWVFLTLVGKFMKNSNASDGSASNTYDKY